MSCNRPSRQARRGFLFSTSALLFASLPLARAQAKPRIGTLGAGRIGGTLGTLWLEAGYEVMFSSRNPDELKPMADKLGPRAKAGTVAQAIEFADAVLLAVPYGALPGIGKEHAQALAKKQVVIDACNPFPHRDGEVATWARKKGAGRATAELLPGAKLVRAFNAISWARLPDIGKGTGMPIAGEDARAIELASQLIRAVGFEPVLVGDLEMGRHLVPGTPLAGEHTPEEIRRIAASLR
jgi:predicted dinucleotide-binding enzyme